MNKEVLGLLNKLEGYGTAILEMHWDSANMSQHKLCEDIADVIADFKDKVAEIEQSISGKLPVNKLKPVPYRVKGLKKFVTDVITSVKIFYKRIKGDEYIGIRSECENFIGEMQRKLYLVNFTMKEDMKRRIMSMVNESVWGFENVPVFDILREGDEVQRGILECYVYDEEENRVGRLRDLHFKYDPDSQELVGENDEYRNLG